MLNFRHGIDRIGKACYTDMEYGTQTTCAVRGKRFGFGNFGKTVVAGRKTCALHRSRVEYDREDGIRLPLCAVLPGCV